MGNDQADQQHQMARSWVGKASIFAVCVVLVSAASQMISTEDPNVPEVLVYVEPMQADAPSDTPSDIVGKSLNETAPVNAKVLGVAVTRYEGVDGVILGDWPFQDGGRQGRYVLSETLEGTRLTVVSNTGASVATPLTERAFGPGRLFTFGGNTAGDYVILADDGTLSFGSVGGIWATFTTAQ